MVGRSSRDKAMGAYVPSETTEMNNVIYYAINLIISGAAPDALSRQQEKNELFLSANGALAGLDKMAHLESKELAELFMDAYMPRLLKRYGDNVKVGVITCETIRGGGKHLLARITADSALARKRLETGILASNFKP
jgi:hypothetical protein